MAKCSTCGTKLGFFQRFRKPPLCDRCRAQLKATQEDSRAKFVQVLGELGTGTADPQLLLPVLEETGKSSGLSPAQLAQRKGDAFRRYALAALQDDILSEVEEQQLLSLGEVLGVDDEAMRTTHKDVVLRLIVARVNDGRLPVITDARLMAKKSETVHAEMHATLMKEVAVREYQGGYSGFSFRIMKGVRYHVGGTKGRSVVVGTELQVADSGILSLTSKRSVFMGTKSTMEMPHAKLVNVTVFDDGIRLHLSNRKNAPLFQLESGDVAAAILNAAVQSLD